MQLSITPQEACSLLKEDEDIVYSEQYSIESTNIIVLTGRHFFGIPGCHMSYVMILDNQQERTRLKLLFMQATRMPKDFAEGPSSQSQKIYNGIKNRLEGHFVEE